MQLKLLSIFYKYILNYIQFKFIIVATFIFVTNSINLNIKNIEAIILYALFLNIILDNFFN